MKPDAVKKFTKAINSIVALPKESVIKKVAGLAEAEPDEPAYHLALAMLSGFGSDFFGNRERVAIHLAAGKRLLDQRAALADEDPHQKFSRHLHDILDIEQQLATLRERWILASREMRRALPQLPRDEQEFFETVAATVTALSLLKVEPANGNAKQRLRKTFDVGAKAKIGDFAGFSLAHAHRQDLERDEAKGVAEKLEKAHPRSVLVKEMLGSIASSLGDRKNAVRYYEEAQALAPESIPVMIGLAIALRNAGDVDRARDVLRQAVQSDKNGRYAVYTRDVLASLDRPPKKPEPKRRS
ncbi:tetratricopeptide repeat protein [Pyxidicoccus parkwayensis]|uniref:Tetratricopeptide repeat protein n=1 Tax=Pyxidicoccus parkwayensis TaxID=2813578 RepID=A0ABX7P637_9BACT|nr:tetratricopeptide repeat protein [Pyxidicoccus parkwaysis]QSQ25908.1 tetratricopeptide repeat protein [Pyxidicoccus parkwaysis]